MTAYGFPQTGSQKLTSARRNASNQSSRPQGSRGLAYVSQYLAIQRGVVCVVCMLCVCSVLLAALQYWRQHQLPVNLGGARPGTAYGQIQSQVSGLQHAHHSQVPGESFPYSLSSQGNTHLGMDRQQYSSRPAPASQAYGNSVLASQTLLQRLQQQSYSQPPQRGAGLDRFFNPTGFSSSQHAPPVPVSKFHIGICGKQLHACTMQNNDEILLCGLAGLEAS